MTRRDFLRAGAVTSGVTRVAPMSAIPQASGTFEAGFAERDITPEIGMEQPGGYGKVFHRKLHDPCKVRAAVFSHNDKRVALVSVDALMVPRPLVIAARKEIQVRCGIPGHAVLIAATHSHSSGPVGMVQPGEYDPAPPHVQKLAYEHSSCADARYLRFVQEQIIEAVCRADHACRASQCGAGFGREDRAAFNRRFRMKNGLTWTHPGKGNPDIVESAGPVDPDVGVIGSWDDNGRLAGCVVNYACHATTSPGGISANWIYYLERTIRGVVGSDAIVLFLPGFCGDVTQVDNLNPYANPSGEDWARLVGGRVGAEAVKALLSVQRGELTPLDAHSTVLKFERRIPSHERVQRCLEIVRKDPKGAGVTKWLFAKEIVLLDATLAKEPVKEAEIQAVQVGPVAFVATPGEMFVQLGLDLKARSPFKLTFPVELANGCVGYVPTKEALGPNGGGYETRLTSYSNLEPSAGPRIVKAGLELLARMKPGEPPTPPKAPPFKEPWSYGNVPAELR